MRPHRNSRLEIPTLQSDVVDMSENLTINLESPLRPIKKPISAGPNRKILPTGYWMFVCKRQRWDAEAWLRSGDSELLYMVSKHNRNEVRVGDLAILRLDAVRGTTKRQAQTAGIYAIGEIIEAPEFISEADKRFFRDPDDGETPHWRAKLRIFCNQVDDPISTNELPQTQDFEYFRRPLQTSSIPISQVAFDQLISLIPSSIEEINARRISFAAEGAKSIERAAIGRSPKVQRRLSKIIERGPEGNKVKHARKHRCQICEALGHESVAFTKRNGERYAEAHHVQAVSELGQGSLGISNIMVLCANHHRQVHYGNFEVTSVNTDHWVIQFENQTLMIERPNEGTATSE